jgi:hypothetical protein
MKLARRDNPNTGLHEFVIVDNGEEYVFHVVKPGRVEKQKRLAAERQSQENEPPQPPQ